MEGDLGTELEWVAIEHFVQTIAIFGRHDDLPETPVPIALPAAEACREIDLVLLGIEAKARPAGLLGTFACQVAPVGAPAGAAAVRDEADFDDAPLQRGRCCTEVRRGPKVGPRPAPPTPDPRRDAAQVECRAAAFPRAQPTGSKAHRDRSLVGDFHGSTSLPVRRIGPAQRLAQSATPHRSALRECETELVKGLNSRGVDRQIDCICEADDAGKRGRSPGDSSIAEADRDAVRVPTTGILHTARARARFRREVCGAESKSREPSVTNVRLCKNSDAKCPSRKRIRPHHPS